MAKARMINTRFWVDNYTSELDPIEKLLFLYFLTNPATDICGIYELPLKNIALDTGIEKEMVLKMLSRFENDKKIYYRDGWVAVKNFIKNQATNPSVKLGVKNGLDKAPKDLVALVNMVPVVEGLDSLSTGSDSEVHLTKSNLTKSNLSKTPAVADDETPKLIYLFKEINPSLGNLYGRANQRAAASRLLKIHPLSWWEEFMAAYVTKLDDRFCPKATTPVQLEEKLGAIVAYARSNKTPKGKVIV